MARGAIVNIAGTTPVDDPEYRYKMPTVLGKIEGRGNGIKTVIENVTEVAEALDRTPGEINKFFGCELGAQTSYSEETEKAVVNGAHTDHTLQDMMHRYIETFVLCPNCRLPESTYKIKNDLIYHRCAACGSVEMVNMQHKLCTYILAQHKKAKKDKKGKDKKSRREEKKDKDKKKEKSSEEKKEKKEKKKDKEKKDKKKEKKEKKKEKALNDSMNGLSVDEPADVNDTDAMNLAIQGFKNFLAENPDASVSSIAERVVNEQMASGLKTFDKIHIYMRSVITPDFFKNNEIKKAVPVVLALTGESNIMERHLISALEFLNAEKPKFFPVMLKQLYDEDALKEDNILEWAAEGRTADYTLESLDEDARAALRAEAEPLIVWLQESDDEDSDSDSDSD